MLPSPLLSGKQQQQQQNETSRRKWGEDFWVNNITPGPLPSKERTVPLEKARYLYEKGRSTISGWTFSPPLVFCQKLPWTPVYFDRFPELHDLTLSAFFTEKEAFLQKATRFYFTLYKMLFHLILFPGTRDENWRNYKPSKFDNIEILEKIRLSV